MDTKERKLSIYFTGRIWSFTIFTTASFMVPLPIVAVAPIHRLSLMVY